MGADPALVTYSNGAVVPFDPAHGSVYSAYPYAYNFGLYGKKKREADPAYLVNTYAAYHPSTYYAGYHPYGLVHQPLVAHLNGAVVPAEPLRTSRPGLTTTTPRSRLSRPKRSRHGTKKLLKSKPNHIMQNCRWWWKNFFLKKRGSSPVLCTE